MTKISLLKVLSHLNIIKIRHIPNIANNEIVPDFLVFLKFIFHLRKYKIPICTIKTHRETIEKLLFAGHNQDHGTALAVSSDPPFGRKLAQRYDPVVFIVQHDLHALVILRHQLGHQLPARAAGGYGIAILADGDHTADGVLTLGNHVKNGVSLGADAQRAGGVHAYAGVDFSAGRFDGRRHAAGLDETRYLPGLERGEGSAVQLIPDGFHCNPP